ncbi:MAG: hypothetical protein RLZZ546_2502 [Bacteroidota bacterium]
MALKKKALPTDWLLCSLAVIPVYARPVETSTMVSQIVFGESAKIIQRKSKQWVKIETSYDKIVGWVDQRQLQFLSENQYNNFSKDFAVALDLCQVLKNEEISFPVMIGSSLPQYDGMSFKTAENKYVYNGQAANFNEVNFTPELLEKVARRFLNAPYFSGGRSIFGMDRHCIVQMIFKCAGKKLIGNLDQMYQSIVHSVDFIELSKPGDIAFFIDKHENISHIGIILSDHLVLHMQEKVRIDKIDHEGIYNIDLRKYTYKLKMIGRVL